MNMTLQKALNVFGYVTVDELDQTTLKKKYLELANQKHPDKGGSTSEFIEIKDAYNSIKKFLINSEAAEKTFYTNSNSNNYYDSTADNDKNSANQRYTQDEKQQRNENSNQYVANDGEYLAQLEYINKQTTLQNKVFKQSLTKYEQIFNHSVTTINKLNDQILYLANNFNGQIDDNRKVKDRDLENIKKQYQPNFKGLINPVQKRIDNEEFVWRQNIIEQKYNVKKQELENNFLNSMLELYQRSIEDISKSLEL